MSGSNRNSNTAGKKSQYERKLARQRQLELMEAAASGTAPSMELDTSSFAETDGSFLRSRQTESSSIDTGVQPNRRSTSSAAGAAGNASIFGNRDPQPGTSLNLMDHATGIYHEQKTGFMSSVAALFRGGRSSTTDEHDASPAMGGDDFVGDVYKRNSSNSSQQRVGPITVACRSLLGNRRRLFTLMAIAMGMFVAVFAGTTIAGRPPSEKVVRQQNSNRFNSIYDEIISQGLSHSDVFLSTAAPEYHALRWVAYSDSATLETSDPMILQRYALASFYYSSYLSFQEHAGEQKPIEFDGLQFEGVPNPGWTRKDFWLTEKGICSWWGVHCEVKMVEGAIVTRYDDNLPIVGLNLTSNRVYGTLPPEFKGLDTMEYLDLSNNRMHGTIPHQMGRMFLLEALNLQRNDFSGQLPAELGLVEEVRLLLLSHNKFTGSIPPELARLFSLQTLDLENNQLQGAIPDLASCHKLRHFWVQDNQLTGKFPFVLAKLTNLVEIEIQNNKISGTIPPEIENLRSLELIAVQNNLIRGTIPGQMFPKLRFLKTLTMEDNQFEGSIPSQIGMLTQLREFRVNNNKMKGFLPTEIENMRSLETLHIYGNKFGGPMPSQVGGMRELREFWAHSNEFNLIPSELGTLEKLEILYLEKNKFRGVIPTELGKLDRLKTLRLFHNLLTGVVPLELCKLKTDHDLSYISADCNSRVPCPCCNKCF